jgi:hypothetical protein
VTHSGFDFGFGFRENGNVGGVTIFGDLRFLPGLSEIQLRSCANRKYARRCSSLLLVAWKGRGHSAFPRRSGARYGLIPAWLQWSLEILH